MVDSRIEVEPGSAWADYLVMAGGGPSALDALARVQATLVIVDRRDQGALMATLDVSTSGWRAIAQDADGTIFRQAAGGA